MEWTAAVITVSDKGSRGEREDTSGPALCEMLKDNGYQVVYTAIVPDDAGAIQKELLHCTDTLGVCLALTTGGTGFSRRDITPEATEQILERRTPGIPEAMRAASMQITPMACLSRETAGIRGDTLIINLPGSRKASTENISAVLKPIRHGIEILRGVSADCAVIHTHSHAEPQEGKILAICISEVRGIQKHPIEEAVLRANHGIEGDAHAGTWHRQVSLLGSDSVGNMQEKLDTIRLKPGDFAENILVDGLCVYKLPVGTRLRIGGALCEVTQIGKECHNDCAIRKAAGDCVMPREGIFVRVLQTGTAKPGDAVTVVS